MKKILVCATICFISTTTFISCQNETITKICKELYYNSLLNYFKDKKTRVESLDSVDVSNTLSTVYEGDSSMIQKSGGSNKDILKLQADSALAIKDTFTSDIKKNAPAEIKDLKYNVEQLKITAANLRADTNTSKLTHNECAIWADVSKKDQRLYLYVEGNCVDTFAVSTGDKKHTTPNIDIRPSGPQFSKYTSKKYPGGSWNGLGNMPYVLFVQGGYGIHGTTIGNIKRLGNPASHGCVRVHPDNAKIIFELVKIAGIENTWVTIRE